MSHVCHAIGCNTQVPPKLLFCLPHWRMVPRAWQRVIWREYRPGQEVNKQPSSQYLLVQAIVVALVARKEPIKGWTESFQGTIWTQAQAEAHVKSICEKVWMHIDRDWLNALPPAL